MELQLKAPTLALKQGEIVTLDDAQGVPIAASTGTIWVTQEGLYRDDIVGPGDCLVVARPGRTIVQALRSGWITIGPRAGAAANDPE
jgi:hypothetical protein